MGSDLWAFSGGADCNACCRSASSSYSGKSESTATCTGRYPVEHGDCSSPAPDTLAYFGADTTAVSGSDDPYKKFCPTLDEHTCADTPAGMVCQWCQGTGQCITKKETCTPEASTADVVVGSSFCYGGSNCTAPCTENQALSGACMNEVREGRLLSFRFTCNTSTVLYETFQGYDCHSAQHISSASFSPGKCYPDAEGTSGTQYSCTAAPTAEAIHSQEPPFEPCAHDSQCGKNGTMHYNDTGRPMCCLASPMAPGLGKCCASSNCVATYNPYTGAIYVCNETKA